MNSRLTLRGSTARIARVRELAAILGCDVSHAVHACVDVCVMACESTDVLDAMRQRIEVIASETRERRAEGARQTTEATRGKPRSREAVDGKRQHKRVRRPVARGDGVGPSGEGGLA